MAGHAARDPARPLQPARAEDRRGCDESPPSIPAHSQVKCKYYMLECVGHHDASERLAQGRACLAIAMTHNPQPAPVTAE